MAWVRVLDVETTSEGLKEIYECLADKHAGMSGLANWIDLYLCGVGQRDQSRLPVAAGKTEPCTERGSCRAGVSLQHLM